MDFHAAVLIASVSGDDGIRPQNWEHPLISPLIYPIITSWILRYRNWYPTGTLYRHQCWG